MSKNDVIIQAENLTKVYGTYTAVDGISFNCRRGEIVGFLGPNGAGKTTTMRMLTGYMPPTAGSASIAGYDTITQSLAAREHLGYLPETVPLYREMSVEGYLAYIGRLRKLDDLWDRIDDALESVGLLDRAESFIGSLSKGMRQRVGLAQAIMHEPDALILDEPTIGLDPQQIVDIRELILKLGERHTILLSTHIMSEVEQICDRVIMVFDGQIGSDMKMADIKSAEAVLKLRLAEPAGSTADDLASLSGIVSASAEAGNSFSLAFDGTDATRLLVADKVSSAGWGLLEMSSESATLEATFLRHMRAAESTKLGETLADAKPGSTEEEE